MKRNGMGDEAFARIVHEYHQLHGDKPYDVNDVAAWADRTGRIEAQPFDRIRAIARDLRRALRNERVMDEQGRSVRRNHAVRVPMVRDGKETQQVLWDDIRTAKPGHMRLSLRQRREGIVWVCKQHKTDTESYNDNNKYGATIPLFDYNVNLDLAELDRPTEYPDTRPDGDPSEDDG